MHTPKRLYINNLKLTNIFFAQARREKQTQISMLVLRMLQENLRLKTEWEIITRSNDAMKHEIRQWEAFEAEQARNGTSTSRGYDYQHPDMAHQGTHQPPPPPPPAGGGLM
jgi:hypothetical protein